MILTLISFNHNVVYSQTYSCDFEVFYLNWSAWVDLPNKYLTVEFAVANNGPTNTPGFTFGECHIYLSPTKSFTGAIQVAIWKSSWASIFEKNTSWTGVSYPTITGISPGNYYIGVYKTTESLDPNPSNNWLWSTKMISITSNSVGINDSNADKKYRFFPNPADNILFVQGPQDEIQVSLIDLQGRTILYEKLIDYKIDISNLSKGIFLLKIEDGVNSEVHRFVKY